jgi:hypothetical protein
MKYSGKIGIARGGESGTPLNRFMPGIGHAHDMASLIGLALRLAKTVSCHVEYYRVVGVNVNTGGYHGTTIGR